MSTVPNPDELARRFSSYPKRTPAAVVASAQPAIIKGGGILAPDGQVHRARKIDYATDPQELRDRRIDFDLLNGSTCACGQSGVVVSLPNPVGDARVDACIHCDAVHKMPKFRRPQK